MQGPTPGSGTATDDHRHLRTGALAGAASALAFTALHHVLISDIWFSLVPMLIAGAICGLCVAWSHGRLYRPPSVASWLRYNATYVALLVLLGVVSIMVFEPVTTIPELIAANGPPEALIAQAMPLTIAFTLASAALIGLRRGRNPIDVASVLVTCAALVVLLGLNVSTLGLVHLPAGALSLVAQMFGLILVLDLVFVIVFLLLERQRFMDRASDVPALAPRR
jgi:hypothetical protein